MKLILVMVLNAVLIVPTTLGQEINSRQKFIQEYMALHPWGMKQKGYNLEALFFDFNGNGIEDEALLSDNFNRDHSGNSWNYVRRNRNGNLDDDWEDKEMHYSLFCGPERLYAAEFSHSVKRLLGRNVGLYYEGGASNKNDTYSSHNYVMLYVAMDGRLAKTKVKHDFSDIVANPGFVRIGSVQTERYDAHGSQITTNLVRKIAKVSASSDRDGLFDNVKFRRFIVQYRHELESSGENSCVYLFVFDADGDGDSDFYISNDSCRKGDGKFVWDLVLQTETGFAKSDKPVIVNRDSNFIYGRLNPSVLSTLNGFYRFSTSSPVAQLPFVFAMEFKDNTALPIHGVLVKDEQGAYGECRLNELLDCFSGDYVGLERLPCEVLRFKGVKPIEGGARDNLHCRDVNW